MYLHEHWILVLALSTFLNLAISENFPSKGYAPELSPCPPNFKVRQTGQLASKSQSLGDEEERYLTSRRSKVLPDAYQTYLRNVETYLSRLGKPTAKLPPYVPKILASRDSATLPRMSFAVAGGAYRGAIFGAALMNVFDGKNATSASSGLGGVLQAADYITGLSGSAWLLTSWIQSELSPLFELVLGSAQIGRKNHRLSGWLTQYGLINPTDGFPHATVAQKLKNTWLQTSYWTRLIREVSVKRFAGYPIGIVDLWGRILSYHFLNGSNPDNFFNGSVAHGADQTFSGLVNLTTFKNFSQPFTILTTLPQLRDSNATFPVPFNATHYEISPYAFGSWDPFLSSFIPTQYLGTKFSAGLPVNETQCCKKFDNAGFVMGFSSNFFPAYKFLLNFYFNLRQNLTGYTPHVLSGIVPNPFLGLGNKQYLEKADENLYLIDGGFSFEVTPFAPLLIGARKVEVILAIDGTGDTLNYANGSSMVRTAQRVSHYPDTYKFPKVPLNVTDYTSLGLVNRPTFFGCEEFDSPLVIWIANSQPLDGAPAVGNTSTLQLSYPINQTAEMMNEAVMVGTRGFPSKKLMSQGIFKDPLWPACLSCAIADRARERIGVPREGVCSACFKRHCWS